MSLAEFLLARIAEDEASAGNWLRFEIRDGVPGNYVIAERVLAECEAKRRIVAEAQATDDARFPDFDGGYATALQDVLRLLALRHADHPDYLPEWRVE